MSPSPAPTFCVVHAIPPPVDPATTEFATVYREHFAFVWRSLRRLGVEPASLDDAAQEVFLVVYRRLPEFEARSTIKTWLFAIALRVAHRYRERNKQEARRKEAAPKLVELSDPDAIDDRLEAARILDELLDALDPERRAVFVLAELEELTAPEVAEMLGIKTNTVYSRLRKAREELERAVRRIRARILRSEP